MTTKKKMRITIMINRRTRPSKKVRETMMMKTMRRILFKKSLREREREKMKVRKPTLKPLRLRNPRETVKVRRMVNPPLKPRRRRSPKVMMERKKDNQPLKLKRKVSQRNHRNKRTRMVVMTMSKMTNEKPGC
jgi:hypothetical protein